MVCTVTVMLRVAVLVAVVVVVWVEVMVDGGGVGGGTGGRGRSPRRGVRLMMRGVVVIDGVDDGWAVEWGMKPESERRLGSFISE